MSPPLTRFAHSAVLAALLTACASGSRIVSNMDPSADFTRYRTFGFMQPIGTDNASGHGALARGHSMASELIRVVRVKHVASTSADSPGGYPAGSGH